MKQKHHIPLTSSLSAPSAPLVMLAPHAVQCSLAAAPARHLQLHQFTPKSHSREFLSHTAHGTLYFEQNGGGRQPFTTLYVRHLMSAANGRKLKQPCKTLAQRRRLVIQAVVLLYLLFLGMRKVRNLTTFHLVQQLCIKLCIVERRVTVNDALHLLTERSVYESVG